MPKRHKGAARDENSTTFQCFERHNSGNDIKSFCSSSGYFFLTMYTFVPPLRGESGPCLSAHQEITDLYST